MNRAFFSLQSFSRNRFYAVCGCSILLGVGFQNVSKATLFADSGSQKQWPTTRPFIANSNNAHASVPKHPEDIAENSEQTSSNDQSSVESRDEDVPLFEDEESAAWASFSTRFATARDSLTSIHWSSLRSKLVDQVLPEWALTLPDYVAKLQTEMEMGPGSLAYEMWVCLPRIHL